MSLANCQLICQLICQRWEESERGWGTRPDGYTLHLSDEDRKGFIKAYNDSMPKEVPDEYSYPVGEPYVCEVSQEVYDALKDSGKKGVWKLGTQYPKKYGF